MELNKATYAAMDSVYWSALKSLSENETLPPLNVVGEMVDVDGTLISIHDAKEIQESAHDVYLTHMDIIEETKHRFVVAAMQSLRKHGYIKAEILPTMLEKPDIIECINMARKLTNH